MTINDRDSPPASIFRRARAWWLIPLFALLMLPGLGSIPLYEPDEGRYAEIPREMLATGDFVAPHQNGVLFFEKPALYYWLVACSQTLLDGELGSRFISFLFALLGLLLTFVLGRSMGGNRLGFLAALILGISPLWLVLARVNSLDMAISATITGALVAFWFAQGRQTSGYADWLLLFVASAAAVLLKGLIGILIPGAVIFLFLVCSGRWRALLKVPWILGTLLFLAITIPWHALLAQRYPDFLWLYFVREHFLRYTTDIADRPGEPTYFLLVVLIGFLPWSSLLPVSAGLYRRVEDPTQRSALQFLYIWFAFVVVFFSLSSSKLIPYVLPAWPAGALLIAHVILKAEESKGRFRSLTLFGLGATGTIAILFFASCLWVSSDLGEKLLTNGLNLNQPALLACSTIGILISIWAVFQVATARFARGVSGLILTNILLSVCILLIAAEVASIRTTKSIAKCIQDREGQNVSIASFGTYPRTLSFYLARQIQVVAFEDELEYGISKLSDEEKKRWFPTIQDFRQQWNSSAPTYLVTKKRYLPKMLGEGLLPGHFLVRGGKFVLLSNRPPTDNEPQSCGG